MHTVQVEMSAKHSKMHVATWVLEDDVGVKERNRV